MGLDALQGRGEDGMGEAGRGVGWWGAGVMGALMVCQIPKLLPSTVITAVCMMRGNAQGQELTAAAWFLGLIN